MDTANTGYNTVSDVASDSASDAASVPTAPSSPSRAKRVPSTTTTKEPTRTSLLPLITPFVQTGSCNDLYSTTYITGTFTWAKNATVVTLYVSDTANPSFTSCQPSGWASVAPDRRNSFSPAVCPSDWTAYEIGPKSWHDTDKNAVATALCCTRYHTPQVFLQDITVAGFAELAEACISGGPVSSSNLYPTEFHVHTPYKALWQHTDVSTLSPQPPDITCGQSLQTWVPGETIPSLPCPTLQPEEHPDFRGIGFAMIGVPIIVGVALLCCCGYCFYRVRLDKDKERAAWRARMEEEERQVIDLQRLAQAAA